MPQAPGIRSQGPRRSCAVAVCAGFALLLTISPALALPGPVPAREWTIDTAQSQLIIHVLPGGLLSPTLHPHHFQPEKWSGEIAWDPARAKSAKVTVRVAADSLRDHQEKLSAKDTAKVEAQTRGPAILDAAQYPEIVFEGHELEIAKTPSGGKGEFRGTLTGTLTLHGKTMPIGLAIQGLVSADRFQAGAAASFKQSEFGIKPYSTALGTISVKDEITVEISIVAVPADKKPVSKGPSAKPESNPTTSGATEPTPEHR
jgi:polyisoprenoid-binding protein YceI